jgi:hypothetical protein
MRSNDKTKATQADHFKRAARELGCDEDQDAFDKVLKRIASAPPPKSVQKRKQPAKRKGKK